MYEAMKLTALKLDYKDSGEIICRAVYETSENTPNPGTKARKRQVAQLVAEGLERASRGLSGDVEVVGEAGFLNRMDVLKIYYEGDD